MARAVEGTYQEYIWPRVEEHELAKGSVTREHRGYKNVNSIGTDENMPNWYVPRFSKIDFPLFDGFDDSSGALVVVIASFPTNKL